MLKYKILYAVMLALAVLLFVIANSAAALVLLILLVLLPFAIHFFVRDNAGKISIKCSMPAAFTVGAELKPVTIEVENKSFLPMGHIELLIEYENHMFGTKHSEIVSLCGSGRVQSFEYMLDSERCGRSEVHINEVYCCDILNITRRRIDYHWRREFTVYPKLPPLQLYSQKLLSAEFGGQNYDRTRKGNDNSEVFQVREYEQGDNLSAAHWKLSAKVDDIIIRDWSRPKNFRLLVLFDLMKNDITGGEISFLEQATIMGLTSSVSRELVDQGIGHNVMMLNRGKLLDESINTDDDCTEMLDDMMSIVVPKKSDILFDEILAHDIERNYSKLVYIGPYKNAQALAGLSVYMDVTVLGVLETGETNFDKNGGFSAYTIPADSIYSQPQFIEL